MRSGPDDAGPSTEAGTRARAYRHALHAFLILLCLAAALLAVLPGEMEASPAGMRTPVIAFELARTEAEVEAVFGPAGPAQQARIAAMELGTKIDMAFMLAYGAALVLLARALRTARSRAMFAVQALTAFAVACDGFENLRLLAITRALTSGAGFESELSQLMVFTWSKWAGLALAFLVLAPRLWSDAALVPRALAVASVANALFTVLAFFWRGLWAELMASAVPLCYLLGFVICVQRASLRPQKA